MLYFVGDIVITLITGVVLEFENVEVSINLLDMSIMDPNEGVNLGCVIPKRSILYYTFEKRQHDEK